VLILGVWINEMADKRRTKAKADETPAPNENEAKGE
jgi:hypothetical protein